MYYPSTSSVEGDSATIVAIALLLMNFQLQKKIRRKVEL
jgi:hypothetical protein